MELRHLRYFVAVAKCLNFTKAAEMLHLSQPSLSRQIRELEADIGAPLFIRAGNQTRLTDAGEYLHKEADRLIEGIECAGRTAKAISEKSENLTIGCVNFFFNASLAPFLEKIHKRRPELKIGIRILSTEDQKSALMSGALDIGFVRSWIGEERLAFEPIAEESLTIISPSHFAIDERLGLREYLGCLSVCPFIATARSSTSGLAEIILAACADYGIAPAPSYECNDAFSIIGLVASGLGWSIVPELELREAMVPEIQCRSLPPRKIVIGLSYRKRDIAQQTGDFINLAKNYFSRPSESQTDFS
jgi:LysR family transcriptional regulator, benzoate and cis,cis-muconate-responsive activator of ben and cat genes